MKKRLFILIVLLLVVSCSSKDSALKAKAMASENLNELSADELLTEQLAIEKSLHKQENGLLKILEKSDDIGFTYISLGYTYFYQKQYLKAYEAFENGIQNLSYEQINEKYYFYTAISAANYAKSLIQESEKLLYFQTAISFYNKAIVKYPAYANAYYGIAVVYESELHDYKNALIFAKKASLLFKNSKDNSFKANYLLARIYAQLGSYEDSLSEYEYIITNADKFVSKEASKNREILIKVLGSGE